MEYKTSSPQPKIKTNMKPFLPPYLEAKEAKNLLEKLHAEASDALKVFPKGNMGLIPEAVKASNEFQTAKKNYDYAFKRLQNFNIFFLKNFNKEYTQDIKSL